MILKSMNLGARARAILLGSATTLLVSLAPQAASAVELNLTFLANEQDEEYDAAQVFKNYVESRTGGEVTVNIFVGAQLCGSANECFESIRTGVLDIYTATAGGTSAIYPPIQGMDIPYMLSGDRVAELTLKDPEFNRFIREKVLESSGGDIMVLSMTQTGGWRNFANTQREIRSPADVEGLRFRTIESQIQQQLVEEMGGSPTPVPWLEVYTALQTGVVDGSKNSISDIVNANLNEQLKYLTLDGHAYMASMWVMGKQVFDSLPPEQQQVVLDGAAMMSTVQFGIQPRKELESFKAWTDGGGEIYTPTEEEAEQFRTAAEPIRDWYLEEFGEDGQEFLDAFQAAIDRAESQVEESRASAMQ
ncbi:TRAP transporter substrate-binding protein [Chelativorans sp. YIM 93263]|uniref:TRAP transporter substrate-binding protein n=1 Tax=Chelativorans sp. YIM 93263 TaxID=2906648 RepID=UPI0023784E3E|nr:TRAP transporter substrate-binding protein DctP [Chelativorans sp. YIM 93263]